MKGLILKDLLLIKSNSKTLVVLLFIFLMVSLNNGPSMSFALPFFALMLCISTFNYDDYNKWDCYAISMPGGRKRIVTSKYITTIILIILSSIVSLLFIYILKLNKPSISLENSISTLLGGVAGISLVMSFMYPLIYKFGTEKGRILLFVLVFIVSALGGLIFSSVDKINPSFINLFKEYGIYILPAIAIIILYISYLVSLKIYRKKEF